ncbi:hypothetical protein SAMN06297129_3502 [Pseudooceanicola antarcticus]|uniref:Sulfotransferase family protein n=1 Tax=Pseudooceanicola antarcticus TaxID=1247613 RepID=A0A285JCR1_9RHOB|nr:hypothetical protein [Pseudooceanicola antarcticus]PJE31382.1 hypothetical protein CVM39_04015 [Pseudooceanicola antarcticus]SNY58054.1 hypothetical protein SAMN06297129_3502 [Pseudooceanicola antarcticus]
MEVVLHAGVHETEADRVVKCLLRNIDRLHAEGVSVPSPGSYRRPLRDALALLSDRAPDPGARQQLLTRVLDGKETDRLILSNENFFCVPKLAVSRGKFYPLAETKMADFREFFSEDHIELFLAIRNPVTYLPAVFAASPHDDFATFLDGTDPLTLRWSELIDRLRLTLPDVELTVWSQEDTPLIWGELLRQLGGLAEGPAMAGEFDILQEIMSGEGIERFVSYLTDHPELSELQRRRAAAAFLDKFALDEAMEEELEGPDWDELTVDLMTELYEDDIEEIAEMPGVRFLNP